jgi:hypothetical protein
MTRSIALHFAALAALLGAASAFTPDIAPRPASAQGTVIQSQDSNIAGLVAEIIQARRREGVLDLRMRLRNGADKDIDVYVDPKSYDTFYVTAGTKKYFVLKDSEGKPLSVALNAAGNLSFRVPKGGTYTWWARYPAPPADVKKVNFFTSITPPFDDIPISD